MTKKGKIILFSIFGALTCCALVMIIFNIKAISVNTKEIGQYYRSYEASAKITSSDKTKLLASIQKSIDTRVYSNIRLVLSCILMFLLSACSWFLLLTKSTNIFKTAEYSYADYKEHKAIAKQERLMKKKASIENELRKTQSEDEKE